jgi:hypothetical protein
MRNFFAAWIKRWSTPWTRYFPNSEASQGGAVPEVDPHDIKAVSQFYQEMAKDHPGE